MCWDQKSTFKFASKAPSFLMMDALISAEEKNRKDDATGTGRGLLQGCAIRLNEGKDEVPRDQIRLIARVHLVTQRQMKNGVLHY